MSGSELFFITAKPDQVGDFFVSSVAQRVWGIKGQSSVITEHGRLDRELV